MFSLNITQQFSYGLKSISWTPFGKETQSTSILEAGELRLLVGANGSGKSTLMKALCGLHPLEQGKSYVRDHINDLDFNVSELSLIERSALFCFEEFLPLEQVDLKVENFIALSGEKYFSRPILLDRSKNLNIDLGENSESIFDIIPQDWLERKVSSLSRGQQVLVQLVLALNQNTPILLLDELFAALDLREKWRILKILQKIARERKVSFLITCHDGDIIRSFKEDHSVWLLDRTTQCLVQSSGVKIIEDLERNLSKDD